MTLPELLERYRVYTIRELSRRTGLSSQQAWQLWHGVVGLGRRTLERLHTALGIPFEELLQVERPAPATRRGPTPRRARPATEALTVAAEPAPVWPSYQERRAAMLAQLQQMKAAGLTLSAMANRLNNDGVPTLSGRGRWTTGAIYNLLKEER
jgi:transcriptional regulator with XRE-family HTH domain